MATLRYNGISIDVLPNQGARTLNVLEKAIYSDDGIDYLWHQIIIEVQGIVNPSVIAVTPGANPGNTLWQLQNSLKAPRGELTFDISTDRVIQAPPRIAGAGPNQGDQVSMIEIARALRMGAALPGTLADCDCDGGPFPEELRIIEIQGIKSVLIYFRIRCTINLENNIVLANRWTMYHSIDELHYTVRTIKGLLQIRRDLADEVDLDPDDFRASVVIPCPQNLQREKVEVVQGSDGLTLEYTVIDRELPLNSGPRFPGLRIEGNATSGYQTNFHQFIKDASRSASEIVAGAAVFPLSPLAGAWMMLNSKPPTIAKAVQQMMPIPFANALVRVYGDKTSSKLDLSAIALNVIIDRFVNPNAFLPQFLARLTSAISIISFYVTQDVAQHMVEARAELIPRPVDFGALLAFAPAAVIAKGAAMNMQNQISLGPQGVGGVAQLAPENGQNPPFPVSNQTVGTYIGAMLAQAFTDPANVPAPVPAEINRIDNPLE